LEFSYKVFKVVSKYTSLLIWKSTQIQKHSRRSLPCANRRKYSICKSVVAVKSLLVLFHKIISSVC